MINVRGHGTGSARRLLLLALAAAYSSVLRDVHGAAQGLPPHVPRIVEPRHEYKGMVVPKLASKTQSQRLLHDFEERTVPNRRDKHIARQLKCSVCVATVNEVWDALEGVRTTRFGNPGKKTKLREFEVLATLEDLCAGFKHYGLELEMSKHTRRYSRNMSLTRHKGGWVETDAIAYCGELLDEYEGVLTDTVQRNMYTPAKHSKAVTAVCEVLAGVCKPDERGFLGAWDGGHVYPFWDKYKATTNQGAETTQGEQPKRKKKRKKRKKKAKKQKKKEL